MRPRRSDTGATSRISGADPGPDGSEVTALSVASGRPDSCPLTFFTWETTAATTAAVAVAAVAVVAGEIDAAAGRAPAVACCATCCATYPWRVWPLASTDLTDPALTCYFVGRA